MKKVVGLGLLAVLALNAWVLFRWVKIDTRPTAWDESLHTSVALDYKDRFERGPLSSVLEPAYFNYPPLYHYTLAAVIDTPTDVADAGAYANFFYFALLIVATYLIAAHFLGVLPGLTAAFLVSAYPIFAQMARIPIIDVALSAWVTIAFLCLIKSEDFYRLRWSVGFGVSLALATLTKWTAPAYIIAPLVWSLVVAARDRRWKLPLLSFAIMAVILWPWYSINLIPSLIRVTDNAGLPPAGGFILKGWMVLLWYPIGLLTQLHPLFLVLFIPGLAAVFWRPKLWPVFLWLLVSFLLFSLLNNKNIRYTMPALPAVAILSVAWLPEARKIPFIVMNVLIAVFFFTFHFRMDPPRHEDWKHAEIIARVRELRTDKKFARIVTVMNAPYLFSRTLNVDLERARIKDIDFRTPSKRRPFEFAEFILGKTGDLGPGFTMGNVVPAAAILTEKPEWFTKTYVERGRWPLPDGSEAFLYHREPQPIRTLDVGLFNMELTELTLPNIRATNVKLRAVPGTPADTSLGKLKQLDISCGEVLYKDIVFKNVAITLVHPQINLPLFLETQEIQLLSLERMKPRAELNTDAILELAAKKAKWLKDPSLSFDGSVMTVSGRAKGIPLRIRADLKVEGSWLISRLVDVRVAGIPLPKIFFRALTDRNTPLTPNDEMLYYLDISGIEGEGHTLKLKAA